MPPLYVVPEATPDPLLLNVADSSTLPAVIAEPAEPVTEPAIGLLTVNPDNVPTEVILGCAAVVTVPAVPVVF